MCLKALPIRTGRATLDAAICRRQELFNAIDNPPEQQRLLMQYSQEASSRALAAYVEQARTALGPTLLQVCFAVAGT